MCRPRQTLYTKHQLLQILSGWECTEPLPQKGKKLLVCWPSMPEMEVDVAEVEKTDLKSSYNDRLWLVTMSSRAGREFEGSVQEAHVVSYRHHLFEQRRQQNLAKHQSVIF